MKLYHISQNVNTGYDTYSDAVVSAESEEVARGIHPSEYAKSLEDWGSDWACDPKDVDVEYIGEAAPNITTRGVICASYHAG